MSGGAGNDVYFVDDSGDSVVENLGEGTDAVFSTVSHTLAANVETLVLQGSGNLTGTGNVLSNKIYGNSGDNTLDGGQAPTCSRGQPVTTPSCSTWDREAATSSSISPAMAPPGAIHCGSSATARVRPSPTSMQRIGRSTSTAALRMKSSPL